MMRSPAQMPEANDDPPTLILGGGFAGLLTAFPLRNLHCCSIGQAIRPATYLELMPTPAATLLAGRIQVAEEVLQRMTGV